MNIRYCLKLKEKYRKFFNKTDEDEDYINLEQEDDYFLHSNENTEFSKTQFTDEEIKNIKLPEPLTIIMFDKIEVQE
jgi:hypothetical protein